MNGLLSALLGGVAGVGEGLKYQDERALRLRQEKMGRLSLASDLLSKGITPPSDLLAGWNTGDETAAPNAPSPAVASPAPAITPSAAPSSGVPQGVLSQVMQPAPYVPSAFGNAGPRRMMPNGPPPVAPPLMPQQTPQDGPAPTAPPTQTGGVSGTDVLAQFGAPQKIGGLTYDPSKSLAMRQAMIGVYGDIQKKQSEAQAKADALVAAGARNPDGSPMSREQAMAVALNGELAFQKAPALGSEAYNRAKVSEGQAMLPVDVTRAVQTAQATAPIEVGKSVATQRALIPVEADKAAATTAASENARRNDPRFITSERNKILDDYRTESGDFRKALQGYEVLKGALQNPGIAQPFAVLDAYARVINPGAVVRQGTMHVLQEMGSYDDRMRRWLTMAQHGQWPDDMLQSIKGTIDSIMQQHYQTYQETAKKRALLRGQELGIDMTPMLDPDHPEFAPRGSSGKGGPSVPLAARVQQLKTQGLSKDAARAQLIKEGYNPDQPSTPNPSVAPAASVNAPNALPAGAYVKNGHPVIDTSLRDAAGHVPTHRLDQATNKQPNESWEQYEARVLANKTWGSDTAKVNNLAALDRDVATGANALLSAALAQGVRLGVGETKRSQARQEMLFQKGRSAPGDVATWTLTSDHTPGRALDLVGSPSAFAWLQQNAPRFGFTVMGDMDPGHIAMPVRTR